MAISKATLRVISFTEADSEGSKRASDNHSNAIERSYVEPDVCRQATAI